MAHAEICPVCGGTGEYTREGDNVSSKCHGCDGDGWIQVCDESKPWVINPQPSRPWWEIPPYNPWDLYTWC